MGRTFGFVGLVAVLGIGLYLYSKQIETVTPGAKAPGTAVDSTAVRTDLLALANAERRYFATNGKYVSLSELQSNGDVQVPHRATYSYAAETGDSTFRIVATYTGSDPQAPKHISIDETMSLKNY